MIKKILEKLGHYSLTNPASVYDEEALTALELAGRTAAKVNDVVDSQNTLIEETDAKLTEQDKQLDAQDKKLEHFERKTIPDEALKAVDRAIADGSFDEAIDEYAGQLTDRLNTIITGQDGIVNDAEVIDGRTGYDGTPYNNIGDAIRGQAGDLHSFLDAAGLKYAPKLTTVNGSYISGAGEVVPNDSFVYSEPVKVRAGYTITFKAQGYASAVAMISKYIGGEYVPVVLSRSGDTETYTYTVDETSDIVFSWSGKWGYSLDIAVNFTSFTSGILEDTKNDLKAEYTPEVVAVEGGYITADGEFATNESYAFTNFVVPAGYTVEFTAKGYKTNVAMISEISPFDASVKPLVISTDSNMNTYTYTFERMALVALSWSASRGYKLKLKTNLGQLAELVDKANKIDYIPLSLFKTIGVVGDSYASGEIANINGELVDVYSSSWIQVLARKHGFRGYNFSAGGYTTRTWLELDKGLPLLESCEPCDLYILCLGINDANAYGGGYVGSASDTSADTYIGNYCRIIDAIREHAPHAKFIISTQASNEGVKALYNEAVKTISQLYGIPMITQLDDPFFTSKYYYKYMGHPIALGYAGMANAMERLITSVIEDTFDPDAGSGMYFGDLYKFTEESEEPNVDPNAGGGSGGGAIISAGSYVWDNKSTAYTLDVTQVFDADTNEITAFASSDSGGETSMDYIHSIRIHCADSELPRIYVNDGMSDTIDTAYSGDYLNIYFARDFEVTTDFADAFDIFFSKDS